MITARETKERFNEDPRWWRVALMDFVDDFRRHRDLRAIEEPFTISDERLDATFAGVIETLCDEMGVTIPDWLQDIPSSSEPYFVSDSEVLKATAIVESPIRLRSRKVFVMENFLTRV